MLNRAHYLQRQAERNARKGRIEDAIRLNKEAGDVLKAFLETVIDAKVRESVRLQAEFHEKKVTVLRDQETRRCQRLQGLRENMSVTYGGVSKTSPLQTSIYKKFEETESLLDRLKISEGPSSSHQGVSDSAATTTVKNSTPRQASSCIKRPKDDKTIIEELQMANSHLRKMVDSIFYELTVCQRQNAQLQTYARHLEDRLRHAEEGQFPSMNRGKIIEAHLPLSQQSPLTTAINPDEDLPSLPPLDLPSFDFPQNSHRVT